MIWWLLISSFFISNFAIGVTPDQDCVAWFTRSKIQTGTKDCELRCATLTADMGTFTCPNQCEDLCKANPEESLIAKFVMYPGLTPAERNLVAKRPNDALIVYKQKNLAEESAARNFPNQDLNDESDAFRHFVWSGLLTKELGEQKATEFLEAHEANPLQSEREQKMDQFNNDRGQAACKDLIRNKSWSLRNLETKALEELRAGNLQVLRPGLQIPKEPK